MLRPRPISNGMNKVQVIITVFVIIVAFLAVLVFSGALPGLRPFGSEGETALEMWGTIPEEALRDAITELHRDFRSIALTYVAKDPRTFESELINALAAGRGPDLIIYPDDFILKHRDKLLVLSGDFLTSRDFLNTFVDGTDLLITQEGILGFPLVVDPLVLYWNRDLFRNESIAAPPKNWDEFLAASVRLTKIDPAGNILQSGAALGLDANVPHFKEIISLLAMQAGNPIVDKNSLRVFFAEESGESLRPAEGALRFFAEFSNPRRASYAWSPARPGAFEAFAGGTLATYFGLASEFSGLRARNPHLNFDIAPVPQIRGENTSLTYGKFLAVGISHPSPFPQAAYTVMRFLISPAQLKRISENLSLAPARRDLISEKSENPVLEIIFRESVKARLWPDIDPGKTSEIFSDMIRSVYSGRKGTTDAVRDAQLQLEALYSR